MKKLFILLTFSTILLSSCQSILEPTIVKIQDVDVEEMNKDLLDLNAFMVLNNPNPFDLDLTGADMVAMVDSIEIAKIKQSFDTKMPGNSDFKMPINIKMDLKKLYSNNPIAAIQKGLQIMSEKKLEVHFKGTIKVGKGIAKVSVPVDQVEKINF